MNTLDTCYLLNPYCMYGKILGSIMIIECYEVVFLMLEMRKASSQLETKLITLLSHNYLHLLSRNSFCSFNAV